MWKVVRRMERRTWVPSRKYGRLGITGAFAVAALVVILLIGWLVDQRAESAADTRIVELARSASGDPVDLIARAARANRLVFLSDIHSSSAVKQLASRAIEEIAKLSGLDAVVLEIGADQQPYIDRYLDRTPEDASILLTHGRTMREPGAATRAYLEIYRTIWRLNQELGADQRIRIVAADLPGWPPDSPVAPSESARRMAEREDHMERAVGRILAAMPRARLFFFMTGLHALKSGTVVYETGGTAPVAVTPLAARLAGTEEAYTLLVDAPAAAVTGREVAPYLGTRVAGVLEKSGIRKRFAVPAGPEFDELERPVLEPRTPSMEFGVNPREYRLRDVADAYINLGR